MRRGYSTPLVIAIMAFAIVSFLFMIDWGISPISTKNTNSANHNTNRVVACTDEAKICPDGSAVGRTGPKCEFSECPTTNINASTNTNSSTIQYFQIKEWGVEFPNSKKISYVYSINESIPAVYFSTLELQSVGCLPVEGPLGAISRYAAPITEGPLSTQIPIIIQGYYYYFTSPQATCSDNPSINEQQTSATNALRLKDFVGLRNITSSDVTAGWKTYNDSKYQFSIQYPATWTNKLYTEGFNNQGPYVIAFTPDQPLGPLPFISVKENWSVAEEVSRINSIDEFTKVESSSEKTIGTISGTAITYSTAIGSTPTSFCVQHGKDLYIFNSYPNQTDWNTLIGSLGFSQ